MPSMPSDRVLNADFHMHTNFSADGNMPPEELVRLSKGAGLEAIAVTDHNCVRGGLETRRIARKIAKGMIVFAGSEIRTKDGEIIALGIRKDVPYGLPLAETCELAKKQNGFIIIPHPFDRFRSGIGNEMEKILGYIDAVEVFNARTLAGRFDRRAAAFAERRGLAFVAGSDSHFASEVGSVRMLIRCAKSEDVLRAVKEGKVEVSGKKTGLAPHWKTFLKNMGNKL